MTATIWSSPTSWDAALRAVAEPGAHALGGGTDLVPLIREHLIEPASIVELRAVPGSADLSWGDDGSLRIGAAVTLNTLATHVRIAEGFPALRDAAASVGSYALRQAATIGGNLCQRVRCWYFRGNHECLRRGGASCSAETGENQYHAIFRQGGCVVAHPSDCAVALVALDAVVHLRSARETRAVAAAEFLVPSRTRLEGETCLRPGELVEAVSIPAGASGGVQFYLKQCQRATWDFALVSLAGVRRRDGQVRLVLGGVANTPWRVTHSIEEDVASGNLGAEDVDTLAERALYDAQPLSKNTYKVDVATALLRRGIATLAGIR